MELTKEQLRQNAAAMLASADGKPVQCRSHNANLWHDTEYALWDFAKYEYRPKPAWTLSRHLPGFRALADGEEWHRQDFTEEEMLPAGWRPHINGEHDEDGDQLYSEGQFASWCPAKFMGASNEKCYRRRTRRPLPPLKVARPWNNPLDVPWPVCWIRFRDRTHENSSLEAQIVAVSDICFTWFTNEFRHVAWHEVGKIERLEHSTDRKTWKPCQIEEDAK